LSLKTYRPSLAPQLVSGNVEFEVRKANYFSWVWCVHAITWQQSMP